MSLCEELQEIEKSPQIRYLLVGVWPVTLSGFIVVFNSKSLFDLYN